jgi:transmembrane sensor
MSSRKISNGRRQAAQEAAEWLVRLQSNDTSHGDREAFVDWLRESPVHIAEMIRIGRIHGALAEFQNWIAVPPMDSTTDPAIVQLGVDIAARPRVSFRGRRQDVRTFGMAAALAALAVTLAMVVLRPDAPRIQTAAGDRRELTLADGSLVDVAPSSSLRVMLGSRERHVVITSGRAFFHVRKDPARPFVVEASSARIRAVGTAFNVERNARGVVVTVTEGQVAVSEERPVPGSPPDTESSAGPVFVRANEQVSISPGDHIGQVRRVNGEAEVAWTVGQLEFEDQAVAEVTQRFNAFNRVQIVVRDSQLAARRVTGVFRIADPESFVTFIEASTPGVVVGRDGDVITIAAGGALGNVPPPSR